MVFAGGVECLVGEDLAGLQVGDDGLPVVDEQFGHAAGVAPADDVVLRDAAASVDLVGLGVDGDVHARWLGPLVLGNGFPAHGSGWGGWLRFGCLFLVEFDLRAGCEFGGGQGLALGAVRFSGGSPAERAVRPLLVVDVPEFGELFVELVDRGRQGTGGEPLLQGAVVAFDLALRLGGGWQGRPLLWRTPISASVRSKCPGVALIGLVVYTVPLSVSVLAGMPCSAHA